MPETAPTTPALRTFDELLRAVDAVLFAGRRFVEGELARAAAITITTSRADKYDRYLADIHLRTAAGEEIFLNQLLLDQGHAVPMGSYAPEDWEKGTGGVPV